MKAKDGEIKARLERFERTCREAGIKLTHQRMEIFREIAESGEHPDAETVFHGVRERVPAISLDTVYRTLWVLSDLGLITTLGAPRERTRFDANLARHHHFVCTACGLTRDFHSDVFDDVRLPDSVKALGRVERTYVEARGLCNACYAATTKEKRKNGTKKTAPRGKEK
ncbi:MAG: transcriptional repressor [Deltaproteobacteria bacterium]|nr:transcriptional repressor [Deltaproteobacteria bacterium]